MNEFMCWQRRLIMIFFFVKNWKTHLRMKSVSSAAIYDNISQWWYFQAQLLDRQEEIELQKSKVCRGQIPPLIFVIKFWRRRQEESICIAAGAESRLFSNMQAITQERSREKYLSYSPLFGVMGVQNVYVLNMGSSIFYPEKSRGVAFHRFHFRRVRKSHCSEQGGVEKRNPQ